MSPQEVSVARGISIRMVEHRVAAHILSPISLFAIPADKRPLLGVHQFVSGAVLAAPEPLVAPAALEAPAVLVTCQSLIPGGGGLRTLHSSALALDDKMAVQRHGVRSPGGHDVSNGQVWAVRISMRGTRATGPGVTLLLPSRTGGKLLSPRLKLPHLQAAQCGVGRRNEPISARSTAMASEAREESLPIALCEAGIKLEHGNSWNLFPHPT
jgi:hypothetical protein